MWRPRTTDIKWQTYDDYWYEPFYPADQHYEAILLIEWGEKAPSCGIETVKVFTFGDQFTPYIDGPLERFNADSWVTQPPGHVERWALVAWWSTDGLGNKQDTNTA